MLTTKFDESELSELVSEPCKLWVRFHDSPFVVTTSRESGRLMSMMEEGVGSDVSKMRERMNGRMDWIYHRNIPGQNKEALKLYEESL